MNAGCHLGTSDDENSLPTSPTPRQHYVQLNNTFILPLYLHPNINNWGHIKEKKLPLNFPWNVWISEKR